MRGSRRASPRVGSRGVSSPSLSPFSGRGEGGGGARDLASGGECDSAASSLLGVGVAGPSRSQESTVLTRSFPSLSTPRPWLILERLGALPGAAPTLALPGPPCHVTGSPGKGDVVPACGLVGRVPGLASRALAPRSVRGLVDACALAGPFTLPFCPCAVLAVPVAVFGPLPG